MKVKGGFAILLSLFLFATISAESCSIVENASCTDNIIMRLSNITNAHGELSNQSNYDFVLCCDFGTGNTNCSGTNDIIGLEYETNAHAEIPTLSNYDIRVCYEDLTCVARTSCESDEMGILSLFNETSSHIGGSGDYDYKICCEGMCDTGYGYSEGECVLADKRYWADSQYQEISEIGVIPNYTTVYMIFETVQLSEGDPVSFEIYERDSPPINPDDLIRTIEGIINNNKSIVEWTITQEDLESADGPFDPDYEVFYFQIEEEDSSDLFLNITEAPECAAISACRDYDELACETDFCDVGEISVEANDPDVTCGNGYDCGCILENDVCIAQWTGVSEKEGEPFNIGSCIYDENTTDNCDDGVLVYSWSGLWTWDPNNPTHYDPEDKENQCQDGSTSVPCPAEVQIPFFSYINVIIALIVITIIYIIIRKEKKVK